MNKIFPCFLIIIFTLIHTEPKAQVPINSTVLDSLTQLSFDDFDQDMEGGWRFYGNNGEFEIAATLIRHYLSDKDDLEAHQIQILEFHCGQMFAMANKRNEAIAHFKNAYKEENDFMKWNSYVDATIAFLEEDEKVLRLKMDEIKGTVMNEKVVKALYDNFGKTYLEVVEALNSEK